MIRMRTGAEPDDSVQRSFGGTPPSEEFPGSKPTEGIRPRTGQIIDSGARRPFPSRIYQSRADFLDPPQAKPANMFMRFLDAREGKIHKIPHEANTKNHKME